MDRIDEQYPSLCLTGTLKCEQESGYASIIALYHAMTRNPQNEDAGELVVQCLKDKGVVEANFSKVDLERVSLDPDNNESLVSSEEFQQCTSDPLGVMPETTEVGVS